MKLVPFLPLAAAVLAGGFFATGSLQAQETDVPPPEAGSAAAASEATGDTENASSAGESGETTGSGAPVIEVGEETVEVNEESVEGGEPGIFVDEEKTIASGEAEETIPVERRDTFYEQYLRDRLRIGTRMLWYSLTDTEKGEEFDGSFLGSINRTTEDQEPAPVYFYLEYAITPYFGLGISYDRFKVQTLDSGGGDGTFELDGPILYGFGRFENGSAFTPFAEIGVAFYGNSFDAKDSWTFANGSETVVNRFEPDDPTGFVIAGGVDIDLIDNLKANLYLRYTAVDFDVDYIFTPDSETEPFRSGSFPGDHFSYGVGLSYTF